MGFGRRRIEGRPAGGFRKAIMIGRFFRRFVGSKKSGGKSFFRRVFSFDRLVGMAVLAGCLAVFATDPYPVQFVRLKTFDMFQRWKPREVLPADKKPVVIIDLDERSLAEVGQWPWSRPVLAQLVQNLFQLGATVVAFDVVFPESDRMNPGNVVNSVHGLDEETRDKLLKMPKDGNDAIFAQVVKGKRVILGQAGYWDALETEAGPPVRKSVALKGPKPHRFLPNFKAMVRNVPVIEKAAIGHGIFTVVPEPDGVVRRVPTLFAYDGQLYPSLAVEMLRVATGRRTILVETDDLGIKAVRVTKNLGVPTDRQGRAWPYFTKSDKAKYVPAVEVLTGTADTGIIKGRMAIIGTSAVGLLDIRSTPIDPVFPGVEVHAQLIESVAYNEFLSRPNFINGAEYLLILFGGILMIWLVPAAGARWTFLIFAIIASAAAYTSWYLFAEERILFDAVFAVLSILTLYVLLTYTGYAREEAERKQVRDAFGFYLAPAMVEKLADDPSQLALGGEQRDMTMLFCDVRGFTTISEQFDAAGLTQLINKLLTPLTEVIMKSQGTVDKYMGDCIMAFWNAPLDDPDHARNACLAALAMKEEMGPLNERLEAEAVAEGRQHIPLKIGTGLNSGEVVVGNMGSEQRFDYSILGDEVNLASRLEGQCKTYAVDIVIGENTHARAPNMATLELDLIKVKGKTEAVRIHTLLGDENVREGNAFIALSGLHDEMLTAYRGQRWDEATDKLAGCREIIDGFNLNGFYDIYAERIEEYKADPPGDGWDGVYVATSK